MSPSTAAVDTGTKKDIYERIFRTPDYFVFDPFDSDSLGQQGLQQGAMRQLLRLLAAHFGMVPPEVELLLQALDLNQLGDLVEVAL